MLGTHLEEEKYFLRPKNKKVTSDYPDHIINLYYEFFMNTKKFVLYHILFTFT